MVFCAVYPLKLPCKIVFSRLIFKVEKLRPVEVKEFA